MNEALEILDEFLSRPELNNKYRQQLLALRPLVEDEDARAIEEVQRIMIRASSEEVKDQSLVDVLEHHLDDDMIEGAELYCSDSENESAETENEFSYLGYLSGGDPAPSPVEIKKNETSVDSLPLGEDKKTHVDIEGLSIEEDALSTRFAGISPLDLMEGETEEDPILQDGRLQPPVRLENHLELLQDDLKKVAGVDVANEGDDISIIIVRHGPHVIDVQRYPTQDVMEMCGYIIRTIDEFDLDEVVIDCTGGWGAGIYARLLEQGIDSRVNITEVKGNQKPRNDTLRALNARAEMFLLLQRRFKEGKISLPMDKELYKALASIRYKISSDGGLFRIVPKTEIKKKIGRSPDEADALALAFYDLPAFEVY